MGGSCRMSLPSRRHKARDGDEAASANVAAQPILHIVWVKYSTIPSFFSCDFNAV